MLTEKLIIGDRQETAAQFILYKLGSRTIIKTNEVKALFELINSSKLLNKLFKPYLCQPHLNLLFNSSRGIDISGIEDMILNQNNHKFLGI